MAPEIFTRAFEPGKADVFALGILFFQLIAKCSPWTSANPSKKDKRVALIADGQVNTFWKYHKLETLAPSLKTLIQNMI
jgi:hypothetical protein